MRDGTPVPLHVARMLACDGSRVDVTFGEQGELLDIGRSTRAIPSAIGRALWIRDGGCRVPGCDHKRHLHGHHIQPWAKGGPASNSGSNSNSNAPSRSSFEFEFGGGMAPLTATTTPVRSEPAHARGPQSTGP
jgi:hypothetical protein